MTKKKPSRINKFLSRFAIVSSFIIGLLLIGWTYAHSNLKLDDEISTGFKMGVGAMGLLWFFMAVLLMVIGKFRNEKVILLLSSINFIYLVFETITYLGITTGLVASREMILEGSLGVFNRPCAVYDSTSGYKWQPVPARVTKIVRNEVIFDTRFQANEQGYISERNFNYTKKDSNTKRFIIFGDSFTAAEFLPKPWPERLQYLTDSLNGNLEFYSFAIDGGGLINWYRTFFYEIVSRYEFDGVIFAIWGDNLDRDFFIMHHTDSAVYSQYFTSVPQDLQDLKMNYLPDMWWSADIVPDEEINSKIAKAKTASTLDVHFEKPDLNFLMKTYDAYHNFRYYARKNAFENRYMSNMKNKLASYSMETFIEKYGKEKASKFQAMMEYCRLNNKHVIMCSVPYLPGINYNKKGEFYSHQVELKYLADHYGADYFDGFEIYRELTPEELSHCFLKYDLHWSQQGSDIFAHDLAKYLTRIQ